MLFPEVRTLNKPYAIEKQFFKLRNDAYLLRA